VTSAGAARGVRDSLRGVQAEVVRCERCPRLRDWCRTAARIKVRRFRDERYWGRPVPGWGDAAARVLIVGLAPAAHGGNRTGRIFTGDRSGDFLFAALHRAGFANRPVSIARDDGLRLIDCYVAAVARCAPPGNRPLPEEIRNCREYLAREWALLTRVRAVLVLGRVAMDGFLAMLREIGRLPARKAYAFGHGVAHDLGAGLTLHASYHPSQQNTFTGKLTAADLDAVLAAINRGLARVPKPAPAGVKA
jgi:uracil-DNA glycosylase family 4